MSSFDKKLTYAAAALFLGWIILHLVTSRTKNLSTIDPASGGV